MKSCTHDDISKLIKIYGWLPASENDSLYTRTSKPSKTGLVNVGHQAWLPEFGPRNPCGRRRKLPPISCPLSFARVYVCVHAHTHIHIQHKTNIKNVLRHLPINALQHIKHFQPPTTALLPKTSIVLKQMSYLSQNISSSFNCFRLEGGREITEEMA